MTLEKDNFAQVESAHPHLSRTHGLSHKYRHTQRVKIPINKIHFYQPLTLSLKITPSELKSTKCFLKLN